MFFSFVFSCLFILFNYICLTALCQFLLYGKVNPRYVYIHALFFGFTYYSSHYSSLRRVPCVLQHVLISCLFYTQYQCVYVSSPVSQFIPPPFPSWCPHVSSLCLCLYFCFERLRLILGHFTLEAEE